MLVESWAGGYHIVSFHSLAVFKARLSSKTLVEMRAEVVLVQTLQGLAVVTLVGLGLPQVSGRTLLCQCWEEKVLLTAIPCMSLHQQLEKFLRDLPTELHQFPWSQSVVQKQCRFWRREKTCICVSDLCSVKSSGAKIDPFTNLRAANL